MGVVSMIIYVLRRFLNQLQEGFQSKPRDHRITYTYIIMDNTVIHLSAILYKYIHDNVRWKERKKERCTFSASIATVHAHFVYNTEMSLFMHSMDYIVGSQQILLTDIQ